MLRFLSIFAFIIIIVSCANPDSTGSSDTESPLTLANPVEYGLDAGEITAIEDHIQWAIDSSYISGGVALIAKNDKIIYHQAFGYSDRAKTKKMSTDNIFRLASMTKPITSTAIMQLVEQGKIAMSDPVSKYIPEFANTQVIKDLNETDSTFTTNALDREITIHHLITHTSGIAYALFHPVAAVVYPQFDVTEAWTYEPVTLSENIPKAATMPLMHQPGEKWTYGIGIDVLGHVVEVASGLPLDQYFKEHIFEPLGMEDMGFYQPDEKADRLVELWYTSEIEQENIDSLLNPNYPISGAKTYFPGGAGLSGTSMDYLKFASALLNHGTLGDSKILEPATVEMMFQNQIDTLNLGEGVGFGYGGLVITEEDGDGRNPGYWGWDGYWQTRFRIDPSNDLVLILMTNAFSTPKWEEFLGGYDKLVVKAIEN